jgi:hypothetical protein
VEVEVLSARHPKVFHVASAASWPGIEQHGLLSATALLELHGVTGEDRERLLRRKRDVATSLSTRGVGVAVIRDQKPLKFIDELIEPGSSLPQFLEALSSRVFFAPTIERLRRLLEAREYRGTRQVVLSVDTKKLVGRYEDRIGLCRFNSGACTHRNHPTRGHNSWLPISRYPYDDYRRKYKGEALAEVTVSGAVPDVLDLGTTVDFVSS